MPFRKARLANSISQRERSTPTHGGTRDSPSHGFQIFHFNGATFALLEVLLALGRICSVQFSVEKSMKSEFPFRTRATRAEFGCGQAGHDYAHSRRTGQSTGSCLDDDFAFHVRVDRAQIVIVARGCKSEGEAGVLDEGLRSEPFVRIHHGVGHGFTIDPGHGGARRDIRTVATGPAPALLASCARQGVDARAANRTVSLKARRTFCDLQPNSEDVSGFGRKCIGSRAVKANLLVWVEAICPSASILAPLRRDKSNGSRAVAPSVNLARAALSHRRLTFA
jgi:hypothetical protein